MVISKVKWEMVGRNPTLGLPVLLILFQSRRETEIIGWTPVHSKCGVKLIQQVNKCLVVKYELEHRATDKFRAGPMSQHNHKIHRGGPERTHPSST